MDHPAKYVYDCFAQEIPSWQIKRRRGLSAIIFQDILTVSQDETTCRWVEAGLCRFQANVLSGLDLPERAKAVLRELGLPRDLDPIFSTDADVAQALTLDEYARSIGAHVPEGGSNYYRIGRLWRRHEWDGAREEETVSITRGSGEVWHTGLAEDDPYSLINSGVEQFVSCLYLFALEGAKFERDLARAWASEQRERTRPRHIITVGDEIDQRGVNMERHIKHIDPKVLQDEEGFWSVRIEEMREGLG